MPILENPLGIIQLIMLELLMWMDRFTVSLKDSKILHLKPELGLILLEF